MSVIRVIFIVKGCEVVQCTAIYRKALWFWAGVTSFFSAQYFHDGKVVSALKPSGRELSENVWFNFGTVSVVERTSAEKQPHL